VRQALALADALTLKPAAVICSRYLEAPEMKSFARSLRADLPAVRAAFTLPWSTGQTEGHVNRLKFLKRQMYGRASVELLRLRVLGKN
jgi:transposase